MFIKDLYRDEIRDGYLVKAHMKKIWDRQLEVLLEIDRICKKHGITYWTGYGTLLGAARHKGFVPWDFDVDVFMFRPEYDRLLNVLDKDLGNDFELREKGFGYFRIDHSQTTMIDHTYFEGKPQGILVDVFALDIVNDGTPAGSCAYKAFDEILCACCAYEKILRHVQGGGTLLNDLSLLETIAESPEENKFAVLEMYLGALFDQSSAVTWIVDCLNKVAQPFRKDWFRETIYLPFETIEVPAPIGYDKILTAYYGDWHKFVHSGKILTNALHSADIPWREFLRRADMENILAVKAKEAAKWNL